MNGGAESPPPNTKESLRVLLAEDSEDNQVLLLAYFEETEFEVDIASNGVEALQRFRSHPYELVLMDMEMPVLDGYQATQQLRDWEMEQGKEPTPVVALTAHAFQEHRERSRAVGCNGYLTKPIAQEELLTAVRSFTREAGSQVPSPNNPLDLELGPLRATFLQNSKEVVNRLLENFNPSDLAELGRVGHRLSGTAGAYGYRDIEQMARSLEQAVFTEDSQSARRVVRQLAERLAESNSLETAD